MDYKGINLKFSFSKVCYVPTRARINVIPLHSPLRTMVRGMLSLTGDREAKALQLKTSWSTAIMTMKLQNRASISWENTGKYTFVYLRFDANNFEITITKIPRWWKINASQICLIFLFLKMLEYIISGSKVPAMESLSTALFTEDLLTWI